MAAGRNQDDSPGRQHDPDREEPGVPSPAPAPWAHRAAWVVAAAALLPLLGVGFLVDDFIGIVDLGPRGWSLVLQEFHPRDFEFLRPLGFLLFRGELSLFGARPWLFHASHLALFVLAAVLAARLASRLAGPRASGWVGALALLYPGRLEAVAWVAAMFDLLALLLTTAALLLATSREWDRRLARAAWLAALCFIAPLAKESAYAIPLVVLAWEALGVLSPAARSTRLIRCGSGVAGAALAFGYRMLALGGVGGYAGTSISAAVSRARGLPEMVARALFLPVNPTYGLASRVLAGLCIAGVAAALAGALFRARREAVKPVVAGLALALFGLVPAVPYLDPSNLVWSHSRFVTIAGLGVALAAGAALAAAPRRWTLFAGVLLLGAWTGATILNELPWLEAARCRDAILTGVERATRGPGSHLVWVAGHINEYRGAQLVGGALAEAIALSLPHRSIRADSELLQTWQHRPVGPATPGPGESLHIFRFDPAPPQLVPLDSWPSPGGAPSARQ